MATLANAITSMRNNDAPYWWLFQGNNKVAQNAKESDIEQSISLLERDVALLPAGSYKFEYAANPKDRSGSFKTNFQIGQSINSATMQPVSTSTNAYGIDDIKYKTIVEEARQKLMFEQMYAQFGPMVDELKDLKSRVKKMEEYLKDDDGDGKPDFIKMASTVNDLASSVGTVKKAFTGSIFD